MSPPASDSSARPVAARPSLWLPALIAIVGALAAAWIGYEVHTRNRERLAMRTLESARSAADAVLSSVNHETFALEAMARRLSPEDEDRIAEWREDAQEHARDVDWIQSIVWVDADMTASMVEPAPGSMAAHDLHLGFEPQRHDAAIRASEERRVTATETIDLAPGESGFLIYVPIFAGDVCEGFVLGVYRYAALFDSVLAHLRPDYSLSAHDEDGRIYAHGEVSDGDFAQTDDVTVHDLDWTIRAAPAPRTASAFLTSAPFMIFIAGAVIALLASVLLHFGRLSQWRTMDAEATNEALRAEVDGRKRAEVALREAHGELERIMSSISDYLWSADVDPEHGIVYRYHSPVVERITGRPPEFYRQGPDRFLSTVHPDDRAGIINAIEAVTAGAVDLMAREYRVILPDQTVRWVRDTVRVTRHDNGHLQLDGVVTDLTDEKRNEEEHRRLEEQIQHAQKLESLGILAGGVAHDFNNLLVGILGNAQLAQMHVESNDDPRPLLKELENAAERAADLTKQLLNYSGHGKFVVQQVDCNELIRDVARLLAISISKMAQLEFDLTAGLPMIEADPTQVRQVVMNLITNASEALGDHEGVITIKTGAMYADRSYLGQSLLDDGLAEGDYVFIEVSDTGCGMDAETERKVFDPFFTTKRTGRGLGMAAALGIVRAHGGAIRVTTEPGHGSTFRVLFAASEQGVPTTEAGKPAATSWSGSGTILVADDEETVRKVAKATLESAGFDVLLAEDGRDAVQKFERQASDITAVVLDLTMPQMGGLEAMHEMKRIDAGVRILLCSGYAESTETDQMTTTGAVAFMQKPYGPAVLIERVREMVEAPRP